MRWSVTMRGWRLAGGAAVAAMLAGAAGAAGIEARQASPLRFEITVPASVRAEPTTGRVFIMISREAEREPRLQIGRTGVPFFGRDIERLPRAGPRGGQRRDRPRLARREPA